MLREYRLPSNSKFPETTIAELHDGNFQAFDGLAPQWNPEVAGEAFTSTIKCGSRFTVRPTSG